MSAVVATVSLMTRMSAKQFHDRPGVSDWRVLFWGAYAFYTAPSFLAAAEFVRDVAEAAGDHPPDVDLRPEGVTVRTFTRVDGSLSAADADLAARISEIARAHGLRADPSRVQQIGIAVAQGDGVDTRPFWNAVLGYDDLHDVDAVDPLRRGPHLWFHELDPPKLGRGRTHIDVSVPKDQIEARVAAALAAGGRIADDANAPGWWMLASPDNHGVDVAAWPDTEDFDEEDDQ